MRDDLVLFYGTHSCRTVVFLVYRNTGEPENRRKKINVSVHRVYRIFAFDADQSNGGNLS